SVYIPSGYDGLKWLGEKQVTERFGIILDHEWLRVRFALNAGILLRSDAHTFTDNPIPGRSPQVPATGMTVTAKNEIPIGGAIAFSLIKDRFDLVAEVTGSIPMDATNYQPIEALGAVKLYLARNSYFLLGGGAGLNPDKAANPQARAF